MIPIRLTIEGLYSYQARQTIEFDSLLAAELFGIFGSTGSGKSSLLDAIFYALYRKTDRLEGTTAGGTIYNLMNLKSNKLFIDFEFSTGKQEAKHYRYTVECKRNAKHYDRVGPVKRQLYVGKDQKWEANDTLTTEDLLGLSYENFKRTIIIPQGKFQDFISLKDGERANMLEDIFGLKKFELSGQTKSLKIQNEQALAHLNGKLQTYATVTQAAIEENQADTETLQQQQHDLQETLTGLQAQHDQSLQLQSLLERKQSLQTEWEQLIHKAESFNSRQAKLDQYLIAIRDFETHLAEQKRLSQEIDQRQQFLQQMKDDFDEEQALTQRETTIFEEKIRPTFENREVIRQQAEEFVKIIRLKEKLLIIESTAQKREKGQAILAQSRQRKASFLQTINQFTEEVSAFKQQLPDVNQLIEIDKWFQQKHQLIASLQEKQAAFSEIQSEIEEAKTLKKNLLTQTKLDPRQHDLPIQQLIPFLDEMISHHKEALNQAQEAERSWSIQQHLFTLSHNLKPGESCPLCGATDHPQTFHQKHQPTEHRKLQRTIEEAEKRLQHLMQLQPRLETLQQEALKIGKRRKVLHSQIQEIQQEINLHEARFVWPDIDAANKQVIDQQLTYHRETQATIEELEQKIRALRQSQEDEEANQLKYQQALDLLNLDYAKLEGEIQAGKQGLQHVSFDAQQHLREDQLHDEAEKLRTEYQGITETYHRLDRNLQTRKNRLSELNGKIEAESQHLHQQSRQLAQLNIQLEKLISTSPFSQLSDIHHLLDHPINIDAEREAIRQYEEACTKTQTSLSDVVAEIGDRTLDMDNIRSLRQHISDRNMQLDQLKQKIGGLIEYGNRLKAQWEEKLQLEKELQKLTFRQDNLKIMEGLFKGKGFVKYVSTMYLENLCAAANQRFLKLTRNALSLEVDDLNQFHIRDLLNGGKRRSIKTLSGGQTFQAALCLALALSDQVQKQARADQNFFFLDEGFGSQDKDSLQTIFQTLKSLRKEKRIVGVISHVEELQQEIDHYLYIHRDPELGSQIKLVS